MSLRAVWAMCCGLALVSCGQESASGAAGSAAPATPGPTAPTRGPGALSADAEALRRRLAKVGLGSHGEALVRLALPCVQLTIAEAERAEPTTRLGGNPWLPPDATWPERDGVPLGFLAQVRCEELPADIVPGLPAAGVLHFFYVQDQSVWGLEDGDHTGWRVLFCERADACAERQPPAGVVADARYRPVPQRAVAALSLPDEYTCDAVAALGLTDEQSEIYCDFVEEERLGAGHQLGGHEAPIQSSSKPGNDWILLLQLDSDDAPGWMWGDVGCLYFWIERDALARRDFSGVYMEFQCS